MAPLGWGHGSSYRLIGTKGNTLILYSLSLLQLAHIHYYAPWHMNGGDYQEGRALRTNNSWTKPNGSREITKVHPEGWPHYMLLVLSKTFSNNDKKMTLPWNNNELQLLEFNGKCLTGTITSEICLGQNIKLKGAKLKTIETSVSSRGKKYFLNTQNG